MSLKCSYVNCTSLELATFDQIAFYQDLNTGGWNLALGPEFIIPGSTLPANISLVDTGDLKFPHTAICTRCTAKLGKANAICGFEQITLNFSAKKTYLVQSSSETTPKGAQKWSKMVTVFPQIRKITATIQEKALLIGIDTVHFHNLSDLKDMINVGIAVSNRSRLNPRRYQWYSYFFSCFNNVLLCLPTGMGKTLISNLLMKAYYERNLNKGQVFIVPTVVLVEQQSAVIERNTGLKVVRRSGEDVKKIAWSPREICVCTAAMLLNAIKLKEVDMSQLSLLIFDEVHEANSPLSPYGLLLPYLTKCTALQRPRILGLTASPLSSNSSLTDARRSISLLCDKLGAIPYTPLVDDSDEKPNVITCKYVAIQKTSFEIKYEMFVMEYLEKLSHHHTFFKSNWKTIPTTWSLQNKFGAVVKILGHSKLIAENTRDSKLHQLVNWMNKWIDSFDILQIFGPRKLIEFIKDDLGRKENDALSSVSTQLVPIVEDMTSTIDRFANEYVPDNSQRLEELLSLIQLHQDDEERILIFVDRRTTAERLCRKLKGDSTSIKLNPQYIIGNSGNGTFSKETQQSILEMFQKGESRLLISTSVLEQGIDVATCGLVIFFDGVKSLKSIIQSRGRARKDEANFVAFVEDVKQRKANELTQLEVSMDYAIRQLMVDYRSVFDPIVKQEIEKFLDSDRGTVEEIPTLDETDDEDDDDDDDDDDVDFQTLSDQKFIHLRFFNFISSHALTRRIESCFSSQLDRVKVSRRFINAHFAVTDVELDSTIIKQVSSVPHRKASRLCSWFDVSDNIHITENKGENTAQPMLPLTFDTLTGFYFKDFSSVSYDSDYIWRENFELNVHSNDIVLSTEDSREFRIRPTDMGGPILINDTDKMFEIFLCLRNPPSYFIQTEVSNFDFSSRNFNLCLRRREPIDSKISWNLRKTLRFMAMQIYNVCNLKTARLSDNYNTDDEANVDKAMDFTQYYLIKTWHSMHSAVLPTKLPKFILDQFAACSSVNSLKLLLNNTTPVRFHKLKIQHVHDVELPFPDCDTNSDYATIGRVEVTPYRLKFTRMEPMRKNRIFRYFPNPENFLLVLFSDEHGGNPWRSQYVYDWFLSVLRNGITVGSKCFKFLGCSNSQLREGRCWFSSLNREEVYNNIGQFPDEWSPGRTLTRLALAFASSCETVRLDHEKYLRTVAPDVKIGAINFSDGIGRCSRHLAEKLKSMLNLRQTTSAFQIRVGGVKGVISVYDHQEEDVMFRKSMKKFESDHNMLEVLNYSRLISLSLNRHVILLLSCFGVPDAVFLQLQHNVLVDCMDDLIEEDQSLKFVKKHSNIFDWQMFPSLHIVREPFFKQMLFSNAINLISYITNHAHIPVSKGIVLMGVMDETNTLQYGEVYAHIVDADNDYELEGTVVVFRNPSVLPSDLRLLKALKRSSTCHRLKQLYQNCLVLPSHGPSSHASECSGGDLDGDIYYVIWDENLIPPKLQPPGERVIEVPTTETPTTTTEASKYESMLQFYCDYVSKNQLGIIANAHLAVSDEYGMLHPKSIALAKYVTAETDAPKKGYTVGKIDRKLLPTKYPDFMQKLDKPSYRSKTVLGELYRQSQTILEIFLEKEEPTAHRSINFTNNTKSIEYYYALYSFEIKTLVRSFNLKSEVDLFSGTPMWREDYMSTYKEQHQLRETVIENVQMHCQKWKAIFNKWLLEIGNDQQKIIEWYSRPKSGQSPVHSFSFLAMPYLEFEECSKKTISEKIHISTMRWVFNNKMKWLSEWRMRYHAGQAIMRKLEGIECHFYGSSMLGLSEEYSDIDLFAKDKNFENLCKILTDLDENAINMKKPHECVSLTFDSLPIDVTNFIGGVNKTYNVAKIFDENPSFWAAVRVLVEWARTVRIVKSGGSEGLMTVKSFCHLFICFATNLPIRKIECERTPYSLKRFGNWMESVLNALCGNLIYDFLKHITCRQNKEWIERQVDPLTEEPLIKSDLIDELNKNAETAFYILAAHEGNVQKLFLFCTKKRLFRIEKRYIDPSKAPEERRKQCLKEIESNCNPRKCPDLLIELLERNGMFYVQVSGDHKFFPDVERGLNKIHTKILNTQLIIAARQKAYHVVNATILIPEYGNGATTEICFSTYKGDQFAAQHIGMWKKKLMCRTVQRNVDWRSTEYSRYEEHFLRQIKLFKVKRQMDIKGTRVGRFFSDMMCNIRCGNHYLFNIPESLHNTFEKIYVQQIEERISHLEETLDFELQQNVINDILNYKSPSLIKSHHETDDEEPLELMPLQEMKTRCKAQGTDDVLSSNKMLDGIRHSFYPYFSRGLNLARRFAEEHGFKEINPEPDEYYTTISVYWRQQEFVCKCDQKGIVLGIRHRSTRWSSTSICSYEADGGDDIRTYLECRVALDDEESCLETIIEYLQGRSIFTEIFDQQIQKSRANTKDEERFSTRPLIPDIFNLDWRLRGMRIITPVLKFINADNDFLFVHDIYDGFFQFRKREFEWFPKHLELEIRMCMEHLSDEQLASKSYDLSLKLFDFLKQDVLL